VDIVLDPLGGHDWRKRAEAAAPGRPAGGLRVRQPGQRPAAPPGPPALPGGWHTTADTASADEPQPDRQRRQHRPLVGADRHPPRGTPGRSRPLGPGQRQTAHRLDRPGFFRGPCLPDTINLPFFPGLRSSFPRILSGEYTCRRSASTFAV
jgi:hypothetical protein